MTPPTRPPRLILAVLTLITVAGLAGCEFIAFVAPRETTYDAAAQYYGLEDQTAAVLVTADEYILFRFPDSVFNTSRAVTQRLQATVPGIAMSDPRQIRDYLQANPYWTTERYSQVAEQLGVTRLVIIELADYRTNEPGNAYLWKGVVSGSVSVVEADGADPNDLAFTSLVSAEFPENEKVGVIDEDTQSIQLGMLTLFGRNVSWLFHDHEVTQ